MMSFLTSEETGVNIVFHIPILFLYFCLLAAIRTWAIAGSEWTLQISPVRKVSLF